MWVWAVISSIIMSRYYDATAAPLQQRRAPHCSNIPRPCPCTQRGGGHAAGGGRPVPAEPGAREAMFLGAASIQQRLCCVGFHHGPKMVLRAVNTALKPCLPCPMPALATGRHGGPSRELPTVHTAPKPCQILPAFPIACLAIFTGWHGRPRRRELSKVSLVVYSPTHVAINARLPHARARTRRTARPAPRASCPRCPSWRTRPRGTCWRWWAGPATARCCCSARCTARCWRG